MEECEHEWENISVPHLIKGEWIIQYCPKCGITFHENQMLKHIRTLENIISKLQGK